MRFYTPTIEEVTICLNQPIMAGGLLAVGTASFEDDFSQCTLERAATFEVIESVRYWKARPQPLVEGLEHEVKTQAKPSNDPLDEIPF